ncbi:MAG TPA: penicillin-binding protein 2 [Actinomycetota bacterium]|nr:penicillin-binding protein 2 [Actinomycetota bacterium]
MLLLAFGLTGARLFALQILDADAYAQIAEQQRERDIEFPARRGAVFDRSGEPLAISVDLKTVIADPLNVDDPVRTARKLSPILDLPEAELVRSLTGTGPDDRFEYVARQVSPGQAKRVEALELAGITMQVEPKRYYPGGRLASHLLGFVNIDGSVLAGVERQYADILEGRPGRMTLEQDPTGRALPQAEFSYEAPEPGRSLFLTIDKELQYFTELTLAEATETYNASAGTAIVMDPRSGELLALANVPDFDPNRPGRFSQDAQRNRALTDMYEPGSAFKIVTTSAALEEGVVTPKTTFTVPDAFQYVDRVFNDSHTHPTEVMSVSKIIEQSSNVGTIKIGLELGGERLDSYVKRFGFGKPTGLDFPGETGGIVIPRETWSGTTIATIPIGQGVAVTPLQMAAAYATIANDGRWVEPKLLHSTMDGTGKVAPSPAAATRRVVSEATAAKMKKILERVVVKGTGLEAQVPGYRVAGKTGTAQKPLPGGGYGNSYVGSFAGFAPVEDPAVVVIVVLDDPSPIWGGSTAAPTFKTITEYALRRLGASPSGNAAKAARTIEASQAVEPPAHD